MNNGAGIGLSRHVHPGGAHPDICFQRPSIGAISADRDGGTESIAFRTVVGQCEACSSGCARRRAQDDVDGSNAALTGRTYEEVRAEVEVGVGEEHSRTKSVTGVAAAKQGRRPSKELLRGEPLVAHVDRSHAPTMARHTYDGWLLPTGNLFVQEDRTAIGGLSFGRAVGGTRERRGTSSSEGGDGNAPDHKSPCASHNCLRARVGPHRIPSSLILTHSPESVHGSD